MKRALTFFILFGLGSFLFHSCFIKKRIYTKGYYLDFFSKRSTKPNYNPKNYVGYSVNAYDALANKPSCEQVINNSVKSIVSGPEGTIVEIPEKAFLTLAGAEVKCSSITVLLKEFYSNSDILEAGLTTSSNHNMLVSGGMIYIEASCSGEKLKLRGGKKIKITMPCKNPDRRMRTFNGIMEKGIVDWEAGEKVKTNGDVKPSQSLDEELYNVENFNIEGEGAFNDENYLLTSAKLGWINCDRFYEIKEKSGLIVKADSIEKAFVAVIFKNIKSVLPGYTYSNKQVEFNNLPLNEEITVIVYKVDSKKENAWYGSQDLAVGDTSEVRIGLVKLEMQEFKNELKALNRQ